MLRISAPYLEKRDDKVFLIAHVTDEGQRIEQDIYYATSLEYGDYLAAEVSDAFVVGCLLPAVLYKEDIVVEGPLSSRLYYNLTNTVLYTLSLVYGNKINLSVKELVNVDYHASGVGCGCSLGVDSFAAMLMHLPSKAQNVPEAYQITHLTYFNVGAMGYVDMQKAKESYDKDLQMVLAFASEVHLPVVGLESNFSVLYKDFDFDASGDLRNFSAVLSLQKLFGKYLYGSSYPIADFHFDKSQTGYYETLLAPMLSTESMEIVIANPDMSRIDKTRFIADNPLVQKYLYVCWKELIVNRWPDSKIAAIKDKHLNCSRCDKCKRTLLALDLMGKLPLFKGVFDIAYWEKVRDVYVAKVIWHKDENAFYKDLYQLMQDTGYKLTAGAAKSLRKMRLHASVPYRTYKFVRNIIGL